MNPGEVKVRYVGLIENVAGSRQEQLSINAAITIGELLQELVRKHGTEFRYSILRSSGELRPAVTIHIDNRNINEMEGLNTRLYPDSEVTLFITGHPDPGG